MSGTQPPDAGSEMWARVARMAELGVMTAALLHELRQPLFVIKSIAELTGIKHAETVGPRMREMLEQVEHIEDLIGHYGGLGRGDEPDVEYDLHAAVTQAVAMLGRRARGADATVTQVLAEEPAILRGRLSAARQIVTNLLQNAIDAVDGQEVREVCLTTTVTPRALVLRVDDTGPGVPEAMVATIFEPFVTTKPMGKGTGLGLFITRMVAEQAGGSLEVGWSDLGGARFTVTLPRV